MNALIWKMVAFSRIWMTNKIPSPAWNWFEWSLLKMRVPILNLNDANEQLIAWIVNLNDGFWIWKPEFFCWRALRDFSASSWIEIEKVGDLPGKPMHFIMKNHSPPHKSFSFASDLLIYFIWIYLFLCYSDDSLCKGCTYFWYQICML